MKLEKAPTKNGCEGCYYEDKDECPEVKDKNLSEWNISLWNCIKEDYIWRISMN